MIGRNGYRLYRSLFPLSFPSLLLSLPLVQIFEGRMIERWVKENIEQNKAGIYLHGVHHIFCIFLIGTYKTK